MTATFQGENPVRRVLTWIDLGHYQLHMQSWQVRTWVEVAEPEGNAQRLPPSIALRRQNAVLHRRQELDLSLVATVPCLCLDHNENV